jgi:catechol 2,3-dioxygenase-like lactoylglutathione lyase family enzyme
MKTKFFYTGIRVKDLEASVMFYTTLLGMKVRGRNAVDAPKGTVVELVCEGEGSNTLELNHYEKDSPFDTKYEVGEGLDHLAFVVKDLDAALSEAEKDGPSGHPEDAGAREPLHPGPERDLDRARPVRVKSEWGKVPARKGEPLDTSMTLKTPRGGRWWASPCRPVGTSHRPGS